MPGGALVLQDAYEAAQEILDRQVRSADAPDIIICSCTEFPSYWVFGFNTRRMIQYGDLRATFLGCGPVVVPKSGAAPYLGRSATPIAEQLDEIPIEG